MPAAKVGEKTTHQSTSTARRRRGRMNRGGGLGGQKAVARGQAEVATKQPVRVDDERQRRDDRWRRWQTGGGGVSRCDATTSQDG